LRTDIHRASSPGLCDYYDEVCGPASPPQQIFIDGVLRIPAGGCRLGAVIVQTVRDLTSGAEFAFRGPLLHRLVYLFHLGNGIRSVWLEPFSNSIALFKNVLTVFTGSAEKGSAILHHGFASPELQTPPPTDKANIFIEMRAKM
jgi:hypothetical protein